MPVLVNICANLGFGAAVAWTARRSPALRGELLTWHLLLLLAFESLVITPAATLLFRFYPQWSMFYWFDPQLFPNLDQWAGWLSGLAVVLNYTAAMVGYGLVRWGIRRDNVALRVAPMVTAATVGVALVVLFGDQVLHLGDYETYLQGQADLLVATPAGWLGIALYVGAGAFVYWLYRRFARATYEA